MPRPAVHLLLERFGLRPGWPAPEHALPGSPERCLERRALADATGGLWLLERLAPAQCARREELALLLEGLARDPVLAPVLPLWRRADSGGFVLRVGADEYGGGLAGHWQLSPLVVHAPLPRPGYLDQAWRGRAVAGLILGVQRAGAGLAELCPAPQADLPAYRDGLFAAIKGHAPGLLPRLAPLRAALTELPALLAAQPKALAHGDLHPLNVLWGPDAAEPLRALIDWEFAGGRPALYDAANCLGCAGFEHPSGLGRGFALGLVAGLFGPGGLPPALLPLLPGMVLASRLGWLSEWLRKGETDLLHMELDYLDVLLAQGLAQGLEQGLELARRWAGAAQG